MKKCYACKEIKPLAEFSNSSARYDGKQSACKACKKKQSQAHFSRLDVKQKRCLDQKKWRLDNPTKASETAKRWRDKNLEIVRQSIKDWHLKNPIRSVVLARMREKRVAVATPAWANLKRIRAKYAVARRITALTGIPHSVDHFYPICSEIVCGLHCEANLRVITLEDNMRKHRKVLEFNHEGIQ